MPGKLELFGLWKGNPIAAFQYLQGGYQESGAGLCAEVQSEWMTDSGHKLKQECV